MWSDPYISNHMVHHLHTSRHHSNRQSASATPPSMAGQQVCLLRKQSGRPELYTCVLQLLFLANCKMSTKCRLLYKL